MDLTAAEQESTLAVRLTFIESPTRVDRIQGDLDAPPVGSGVARSIDNDRLLTLTWQVRDTHRSDGSTAALGDLSEAPFSTYNTDEPGLVRNDVNATGYPADGSTPVRDDASDTVVILDRLPTTTTTKDWLGGPVAIPSPGTPEDRYPRTRLRIQTTNTTPARVDQLQITDPAPGSTTDPFSDPFDYFRLVRIAGHHRADRHRDDHGDPELPRRQHPDLHPGGGPGPQPHSVRRDRRAGALRRPDRQRWGRRPRARRTAPRRERRDQHPDHPGRRADQQRRTGHRRRRRPHRGLPAGRGRSIRLRPGRRHDRHRRADLRCQRRQVDRSRDRRSRATSRRSR